MNSRTRKYHGTAETNEAGADRARATVAPLRVWTRYTHISRPPHRPHPRVHSNVRACLWWGGLDGICHLTAGDHGLRDGHARSDGEGLGPDRPSRLEGEDRADELDTEGGDVDDDDWPD